MFTPFIAKDAELKSLDWKEAQLWSNFVLFQPTWLPSGTQILQKQLRPESENGETSTYRFLLVGPDRKLSVKQFLYDWAPPAYDHPSLWRNPKISTIDNTPIPQPFLVNQDVAWIGLNFRRERAASFHTTRTMIELTALEGNFTDSEFIAIFQGLEPADQEAANRILNTPFSQLCHSHRHRESTSDVPLSYWKYKRQPTWQTMPSLPLDSPIQIPSSFGYVHNCSFQFGEPVFETETYFEHLDSPGSTIRLLTTPFGRRESIPYPPLLGDQTCTHRLVNIRGVDVHIAYLKEIFGPYEAIWRHNDTVHLILVKPAAWTNGSWFQRLLHELVPHERST